MTDAPRRVLAFLIGTHCQHYSRARLQRATGLSLRTINRALGKLVEISAITRTRGGRSTPAKIRVLMSLEAFVAHQVKMAHQVSENGPPKAESGPLSGALRALEVVLEQEQQPRKPQGVEIPPMEIQNEFGRWELNPTWIRYRDIEQRIGRARNPAAYTAAVRRKA